MGSSLASVKCDKKKTVQKDSRIFMGPIRPLKMTTRKLWLLVQKIICNAEPRLLRSIHMKNKRYKLVGAGDLETLERRVNEIVEDGFEPEGGLFHNAGPADAYRFCQAMIKRDGEPNRRNGSSDT
jgi:hypothetical protein